MVVPIQGSGRPLTAILQNPVPQPESRNFHLYWAQPVVTEQHRERHRRTGQKMPADESLGVPFTTHRPSCGGPQIPWGTKENHNECSESTSQKDFSFLPICHCQRTSWVSNSTLCVRPIANRFCSFLNQLPTHTQLKPNWAAHNRSAFPSSTRFYSDGRPRTPSPSQSG